MKTSTMLCATAVVLVQALCASAAGGERQQQLPLFFQAGRPFNAPGAPLPKFVGIAGNQQPQAFRSLPPQVDEELDDEEQRSEEDPNQRSSGFSTPLPFRPQPTPQVSPTSWWWLEVFFFFFTNAVTRPESSDNIMQMNGKLTYWIIIILSWNTDNISNTRRLGWWPKEILPPLFNDRFNGDLVGKCSWRPDLNFVLRPLSVIFLIPQQSNR